MGLIGSWHWQFGSWILFDSCFLGNFCLIFIKFISKYSKLTNIKHQTWRHGSNGANIPQLYDYRTLHVYWEVSRWNIQGSFYITNPNKPLLFSGSPWKLSYICIKFDTPRVSLNYPGQPTAYTAKSTGVRLLSKASQGPSLWFSWGWRCRCLLAGKTIVLFHRWDMLLPRRVDLHDLHHLFQRISFTICKTRPCMWLSWQLHKIPVTSPIDGWSREIYRPFRNQFDENIHIIKHLYRNVKKSILREKLDTKPLFLHVFAISWSCFGPCASSQLVVIAVLLECPRCHSSHCDWWLCTISTLWRAGGPNASGGLYVGMALKTLWIVPRWSGRLERGDYVKGHDPEVSKAPNDMTRNVYMSLWLDQRSHGKAERSGIEVPNFMDCESTAWSKEGNQTITSF